jgi:chemotaxis protein methyltransferase CheR
MTEEVERIAGIDLSMYSKSFLDKTVNGRMSKLQCISEDEYLEWLKSNSTEKDILKKALNNNYSTFFRNTLTFSYLEHIILPKLVESKFEVNIHEIRIWSAACAAGQEAYSIAMLCDEYEKKHNSGIRFRIFATDISETEIHKASIGLYHESAVRNVSYGRLKNYFTQKGDSFVVNQGLRETIDFSTFDLLNEECSCPTASVFGNFDLVFCANLLFYYKPAIQQNIIDKVDNCLANKGYLVVGDAEKEIAIQKKDYICIQHLPILQK